MHVTIFNIKKIKKNLVEMCERMIVVKLIHIYLNTYILSMYRLREKIGRFTLA